MTNSENENEVGRLEKSKCRGEVHSLSRSKLILRSLWLRCFENYERSLLLHSKLSV